MIQNIIALIIISISVIFTIKWFYKFIKSSKKTDHPTGCEPEACGNCSYKEDNSCESDIIIKNKTKTL